MLKPVFETIGFSHGLIKVVKFNFIGQTPDLTSV